MPCPGENTQTNQTQTRTSRSSGSQCVGRGQERTRRAYSHEHPPRHSEPEHPPRPSGPEHPPRCSDGESDEEEEDNAEFSTGKVPYVVWEASLY